MIVSVLPGKTLGVVYIAAYESGSVLEYNELIVAPASVRYRNKLGSWISHIYVDNENSVAGGREIWGLPKEMAQFTWGNRGVSVRQNDRILCHLRYQKGWFDFSTWWRQNLSGNTFSYLGDELLFFNGKFKTRFGFIKSHLEIPAESPIADLQLTQPWLTLNCQQLELIAGQPEVVGKKLS